jgi:hypothetical protein
MSLPRVYHAPSLMGARLQRLSVERRLRVSLPLESSRVLADRQRQPHGRPGLASPPREAGWTHPMVFKTRTLVSGRQHDGRGPATWLPSRCSPTSPARALGQKRPETPHAWVKDPRRVDGVRRRGASITDEAFHARVMLRGSATVPRRAAPGHNAGQGVRQHSRLTSSTCSVTHRARYCGNRPGSKRSRR